MGIFPITKTCPGLIGRPPRVVTNVFVPVPIAMADFVSPMMRPAPAPRNLIAFEIVTGVDHVNWPDGSAIVSPA